MKRIIFGGAFDPIHNGHINMALSAAKQIGGHVIFVPSKVSVWKTESVAVKHKKKMVQLAIKDYDCFSLSDFELTHKDKFVYSIFTIKHFIEMYPDDKIFYLIGGDQANKFHLWKYCDDIAKYAQILVFPRKDVKLSKKNVDRFNMIVLKGEERSDASNNIRSFKEIDIPYPVIQYIEEHSLYYIPKLKEWYGDRYNHVKNVAELSHQIAKNNGFNPQKAYIAGFLHDLGKKVHLSDTTKDYSEEIKYLNTAFEGRFKDLPPYAIHQVLGVYYAQKEFGIEDPKILNAILWHCTANENMNWIEKIVYAADKIEPSRGYDSSKLIQAMMDDLDEGFVTGLRANIDYIHPKMKKNGENEFTEKAIKYYLK